MQVRLIFPLLLLLLSFPNLSMLAKETPVTLDSNSTLPKKEIKMFYGKKQWNEIKDLEYDGYVIFKAGVTKSRELKLLKILASYPDDSRNELAEQFAEGLKLQNSNVGSRIKKSAKVYVIFYEKNHTPNQALVIGKRNQSISSTESVGGNYYMTVIRY